MTDKARAELTNPEVSGAFVSGGCTRYVQPLDVALDQPLKLHIKKLAQLHRENNKAGYESGKYKQVCNTCILLTHLVAEARAIFHSSCKPTIIEAFRRKGLNLNRGGSEDHEIKIKGLESRKVGDWRARGDECLKQDQGAAASVPEAIKDGEQRAKEKKRAHKTCCEAA